MRSAAVYIILIVSVLLISGYAMAKNQGTDNEYRVLDSLAVGEVISGTRISTTLLTHGGRQ